MTTSPKNTAAPFVVLPPLREPYFVSTTTLTPSCNSSGICGIGIDIFRKLEVIRRLARLSLDREASYRIHDMSVHVQNASWELDRSCSADVDAK